MELVRQLTLIDYKLYSAIPVVELTDQSWNKKGCTPSVTAFIDRFNQLSYWVVTEIVLSPNIKKRVAVMKRFINMLEASKTKDR